MTKTENNAAATGRFVVLTSGASMPSSCYGRYRRVVVLELEPGFDGLPTMISRRARGVRRIVRTWEKLNVGRTDRCAYAVALREAMQLAAILNRGAERSDES